jgi:CRISPR-associated protein Cas2
MDPNKFKMGWMHVAFDLPVLSKEQRKAATQFRNFLLKDGYLMIQYSVYARATVTHSRMQTHLRRLKKNIPPEGSVRAIYVTQAQWERSFVMYGKPAKKAAPESIPEQLNFL